MKDSFGHLVIDLDPLTSNCLRYCSDIVTTGPSFLYLPLSKSEVSTIISKLEKLSSLQQKVHLNPTQLPGSIRKKKH